MSFWGKYLLTHCDANLSINVNDLYPDKRRDLCLLALKLGIKLHRNGQALVTR